MFIRGKSAELCLQPSMHAQSVKENVHPRFQNQDRLVTQEVFLVLPPHPPTHQCEEESFPLKIFPDPAQLVWKKYIRRVNVILAEQIRNVFHGHIPILVQS